MDIIKELVKKVDIDIEEKQISPDDLFAPSSFLLTGEVPPDRKTSELLRSSTGWVYACVNAIADEIGFINIRLFRFNKNGSEEIFNNPILDLLHRANDFTTKFDLFWLTTNYLELTGEAPWFLVYEGNKPSQIVLLRPDRLKVIPGENVNEIIKGYKYNIGNGQEIDLEFNEVIFLRYPDPAKPFRGIGTLSAAALTFDIDKFSEEWNKKFYWNSGRPDSVLTTEQKLTKTQIETLEDRLRKFKSITNAHKMMILQKGLKYEPMAISQKDMDFMKQQEFSRDKILGIFRVPKSVLGLVADSNRSNTEASDVIFAKRTIRPKMQRIIEQLNEFLLPLFSGTENMFLSYDDPIPENSEAATKSKESALKTGYATINEIRERSDLESIGPEGDKIRIPNNLVSIEESSNPAEKKLSRNDKVFIRQMKARNRKKEQKNQIVKKVKEVITKQIEENIIKIMKTQVGIFNGKKKKKIKKKEEDNISSEEKKKLDFQSKQLQIADKFEEAFLRRVRSVFRDQRDAILRELSSKAVDPKGFKLDPDKWGKKFSNETKAVVLGIIKEESDEAFNFLEIEDQLDLSSPSVKNYTEVTTFRYGREVTKTTNKQVERVIALGVNKGESIPQITERVKGLFSQISTGRAVRITRSEVIRAANFATEQSYIQSGVVSHKEWLTALDDRVCQFCMPMNGRVVGLKQPYHKYNDNFEGNQGGVLRFNYTEIQYPPLHPQCRCTIIPIVVKSFVSSKIKKLEKEKKELVDEKNKIDNLVNGQE